MYSWLSVGQGFEHLGGAVRRTVVEDEDVVDVLVQEMAHTQLRDVPLIPKDPDRPHLPPALTSGPGWKGRQHSGP
jgi:hypothetical protein